MVARHFYRFVEGDPVTEVPNVLRWGYRVTQQAEEGQAGSYEIVVDDADMELDFVGHRRWIIYEDESDDDNQVLVDGIVQSVSIAHAGGDITNPIGRTWVVNVFDLNTLWTYRVMTGSDSQFPEQTDVERMQQLVDSEEMGYFDDLSLLSASSPQDVDELNGRGRTPAQIADECAQDTGKNWWIDSIGAIVGGADIRVWYGHDSLTAYTSPLSLSNDPADLDMPAVNAGTATTYPIGADTSLKRDYGRQYSGAYGEFQGGAKYISADENPYAPEISLGGRDMVTPAPEIKSRERMKRRLLRNLRDSATPDEVISTTITLPANKVTQCRAGMRIPFKATHEPGYEEFAYLRIMSATPRPIGQRYEVALEMQGPGAVALSCSSALAAAEAETNYGPELGGTDATVIADVTSSMPDTGIVVAGLIGGNGNTPNSENMTTPSGFSTFDTQPDFGRVTYFFGYKAVSAGSQNTSASFESGFASEGLWGAAQVWLPWTSVSVVQETVAGANPAAVTLASPPTPGNTILMLAISDRRAAPTPGGVSGPSTGWTELFGLMDFPGLGPPSGSANSGINLYCWARCVQEGDGLIYDYSEAGPVSLMTPGTYVVEIAAS